MDRDMSWNQTPYYTIDIKKYHLYVLIKYIGNLTEVDPKISIM